MTNNSLKEHNKSYIDDEFSLLHDIEKITNEFKQNISKKEVIIKDLIPIFEERKWLIDISPAKQLEIRKQFEIYGVDGSNKLFKGIGSVFYSTWSTVSVKKRFPNSKDLLQDKLQIQSGVKSYKLSDLKDPASEKLKNLNLSCGIQDLPTTTDQSIKLLADNDMLDKETDTIKNIEGGENIIIFIDGPLVDPPKNAGDAYIKKRAKAIREHLKLGTKFYCVVKRIFDNFYIKDKSKTISTEIIKKLNYFADDSELLETLYINYNWGKNIISDLIKLNNVNSDHKKYSQKGIDIYAFYLKMESKGSVIRVEYPVLKDRPAPDAREIIPILISQVPPGYNLPEPIILAHFLCNKHATQCFNLFQKMLNVWAKDYPKYLVAIKNLGDLEL